MAEINNTQWLEEYLNMWTPKERMGRIHKVTTFDPTYHCYPEGVYLLDDDCRAHTAIYVVDKNHNVHIICDGMAWDLLARAVEEGANSIVLQLEKGNKGLSDILNEMLKAHNTCCAGLQEKLKRIGDQLERIGNNTDGINGDIKRIADSSESIKDDIKRIADKIDEGGGTITPSKKTLLLAEPDRHKVTEDKKVYTSAITSIVNDVPEQPWTITDDFDTYPSWATVSTDKGHVYITTDGSKPGKGKNDPWNIEPEPEPEPEPKPDEVKRDYFTIYPSDAAEDAILSVGASSITGKIRLTYSAHIYDDPTKEKETIVVDYSINDYTRNRNFFDAFFSSKSPITDVTWEVQEPIVITKADGEHIRLFPMVCFHNYGGGKCPVVTYEPLPYSDKDQSVSWYDRRMFGKGFCSSDGKGVAVALRLFTEEEMKEKGLEKYIGE